MSAQHTPGPWIATWKFEIGPVSKEDDQSFGMVIPIADALGDNREANARLIAAAPQLLLACEGLLAIAETGVTSLGAIRVARAAIAKATGSES